MNCEHPFDVRVAALNFRSAPRVTSATRIAVLPQGHRVCRLDELGGSTWWQVETMLDGNRLTGFVSHRFLEPASQPDSTNDENSSSALADLPTVHLAENRLDIRRNRDGGRAYPLGEPGPRRALAGSDEDKRRQLLVLLDWLDVERSARYQKKHNATYCNIYAYDVCYLSEVFLPRVWFTQDALLRIVAGEAVAPRYNRTVTEMSANRLFDWLLSFGTAYGWRRTFDLDLAQAAANDGKIGLIIAARRGNGSGHVSVIAPEIDQQAVREQGRVVIPLQSQAGWVNKSRFTTSWWTQTKFRDFAFWIHE